MPVYAIDAATCRTEDCDELKLMAPFSSLLPFVLLLAKQKPWKHRLELVVPQSMAKTMDNGDDDTNMPQVRRLTYRLLPNDDINTQEGSLHLYGDPQSQNACFFCGGFPDDHTVWEPMVQNFFLKDNFYCGVTCLAGFDGKLNYHPANGYKIPQMTEAFASALQTFVETRENPKSKVTVIVHDWATFIGVMAINIAVANPNISVDQIILLDVLPKQHPNAPNLPSKSSHQSWISYSRELFVKGLYRACLTTTFILSRFSKHLASAYVGSCLVFGRTFNLLPLGDIDFDVLAKRENHGLHDLSQSLYKCYPYYQGALSTLPGQYDKVLGGAHLPVVQQSIQGGSQDQQQQWKLRTPVLYMYGATKTPFGLQFHSVATVEWLHQQEDALLGGRVLKVDNAGHWLFVQQPEICYRHMKEFILDSNTS